MMEKHYGVSKLWCSNRKRRGLIDEALADESFYSSWQLEVCQPLSSGTEDVCWSPAPPRPRRRPVSPIGTLPVSSITSRSSGSSNRNSNNNTNSKDNHSSNNSDLRVEDDCFPPRSITKRPSLLRLARSLSKNNKKFMAVEDEEGHDYCYHNYDTTNLNTINDNVNNNHYDIHVTEQKQIPEIEIKRDLDIPQLKFHFGTSELLLNECTNTSNENSESTKKGDNNSVKENYQSQIQMDFMNGYDDIQNDVLRFCTPHTEPSNENDNISLLSIPTVVSYYTNQCDVSCESSLEEMSESESDSDSDGLSFSADFSHLGYSNELANVSVESDSTSSHANQCVPVKYATITPNDELSLD